MTAPIHAGDEFLGVVGADVPIARLEAMVLPVLARIAPDAALLTADGRVIASASPRLLPGHRVDTSAAAVRPAQPDRRRRLSGVGGWLVTRG